MLRVGKGGILTSSRARENSQRLEGLCFSNFLGSSSASSIILGLHLEKVKLDSPGAECCWVCLHLWLLHPSGRWKQASLSCGHKEHPGTWRGERKDPRVQYLTPDASCLCRKWLSGRKGVAGFDPGTSASTQEGWIGRSKFISQGEKNL